MKDKEFTKKEVELLKLADHFKDSEDNYDNRIIRNLIILYTKWDNIDKIKNLRNITNKKDLHNQIDSAVSLLETKGIKEGVEKAKKEIEKERIRSVEILGVFAAIITFIISTVQISTAALKVGLDHFSAIALAISIGFVLIVFIVALHLIVIEKKTMLLFFTLLFFILAFTIIQYFPYFFTYFKNILNLLTSFLNL